MHSKCVFKHFNTFSRLKNPLLICAWVAGLLVGILSGIQQSQSMLFTFSTSMVKPPSLLTGVFVMAIPVLTMVLILISRCDALAYPLFFIYALSHGFCSMLLSCFWGSGSWLLRLMLLFPATGISFLLWFLLLRYQFRDGLLHRSDVAIALLFLSCISVINHFSVSPVLVALVDCF